MGQLIITTGLENIKSVFEGGIDENITRYKQLKKLFENNKLYRLFSEPVTAGDNKIAWQTEYTGKIIPFRKLDDDEKEDAKVLLKKQVNDIYKTIISIIDDREDVLRLFKLVDAALHIPAYDDIYLIQETDGTKNFCLVIWGFISEIDENYKNPIEELVPLKVADVSLVVIKGNNKLAVNEDVSIEMNAEVKKYTTDENACIELKDIPLLTEIIVYQDKDGQRLYEQHFTVKNDDKITFFIGNEKIPKQNVEIQALDDNDNIVSNITFKIVYDDVEFVKDTDQLGKVDLGELYIGTKVNCIQMNNDREIKKVSFDVVQGKNIYFVNVVKQNTRGGVSLRLIDEEQRPIPFALLEVTFPDGKKIKVETNEDGKVDLYDVPFKEDIIFRQIIDGLPQFQQTLKLQEANQSVEIKGKQVKPPHKFSDVSVTVTDIHDIPVSNLRIKLENGVTPYHKITDNHGVAIFKDIDCDKTITVIVQHKGHKRIEQIRCEGKQTNVKITLGTKIGYLWLWILLAFLGLGLLFWLVPKIDFSSKKLGSEVVDTMGKDTVKPIVKQLTRIKFKDENNNVVKNLQIKIYDSLKNYNLTIDNDGFVELPDDIDTTKFYTFEIEKDGKVWNTLKFVPQNGKIVTIHSKGMEFSEIPVPCGVTIKSKGFHSTVKSFKMTKAEGYFLLKYNMNQIPDRIIVYNGGASTINDEKIIYQTPNPVSYAHIKTIHFKSPDSLITVEIQGGDTALTQWDFTVYCPKKIKIKKNADNQGN